MNINTLLNTAQGYADTEKIVKVVSSLGMTPFIVLGVIVILSVVCQWRIFSKAGEKGWKSLIPIYNGFVLARIVFGKTALGILYLVPVIGQIFGLITNFKLPAVLGFGLSIQFMNVLFAPICQIYLAFVGAPIKRDANGELPKKPMKYMVGYQAYYPEINMIRTAAGYSKLYRMNDIEGNDRVEYEAAVKKYLKFSKDCSVQISHINNEDYIIFTVKAITPEQALTMLNSLNVTFEEVALPEWFSAITAITRFQPFTEIQQIGRVNKKGKPEGTVLPHLQPFYSTPKFDPKGKVIRNTDTKIFPVNDMFVRTVVVTNFPEYIYPSLFTELTKVTDKIVTALFLREIDKTKCAYSFDNFADRIEKNMNRNRAKEMKEALKDNTKLINTCLLISVYGDTTTEVNTAVDNIRTIARRYLSDINVLDHQQVEAYQSVLPLGQNRIMLNKVLMQDDLTGLMPLSWCRHVSNGIYYGHETETGKDIYHNRVITRKSGFILGSDPTMVQKRIINEAEQLVKYGKQCVEIYTIDSALIPDIIRTYGSNSVKTKLITSREDTDLNKAIYKHLLLSAFGTGVSMNELSTKKKSIMKAVLDKNAADIEAFKGACAGADNGTARALDYIKDEAAPAKLSAASGVHVYVCDGGRRAERVAQLMKLIAQSDADVVYIVNTDVLCGTNILSITQRRHPNTIFNYSSITTDKSGLKRLYSSTPIQKMIQNAEFIDISRHDTVDRIHLSAILEFDKTQKAIIGSQDGAEGILIAGDTMYIYDALEDLPDVKTVEHKAEEKDEFAD